eukprot:259461_1
MATSLTVVNLIDELLQLFTQDSQRPDCLAKNTFNITFTSEDNKKYNQITKDIMIGYVKHIQSLLKNYDIPPLIIHICLQYYDNCYLEVFTKIGNNLNINKQFNTIENKLCNKWGTAYGNMEINNKNIDNINIYIWTFKIISIYEGSTISIGIDSSKKQNINTCFHECHHVNKSNYGYYAYELLKRESCTYKYSHNNQYNVQMYGTDIIDGDTIKMELNMKNKILKFYNNNTDQGIAYDNIDFSDDQIYSIAVYI